MYGETPDMTGGFGQKGVDAFAQFLEQGGTLIAANSAVSFPIEFGFAHTVDNSDRTSDFYAPRPILQTKILQPESQIFYGYGDTNLAGEVPGRAAAPRRRGRPGKRPRASTSAATTRC